MWPFDRKSLFILALAIFAGWFFFWRDRISFDPAMLKNKVVVICGASSGIGEEMAYQYAAMGARLVLAARREERLQKVKAKCKELGSPDVHYVVSDFGKDGSTKNLHKETKDTFGRVDTLILNHDWAIYGHYRKLKLSHSEIHDVLEVKLVSHMKLATLFTPDLIESGGNIGIISAISALTAIPGVPLNSLAKSALHGFFDAYRLELRQNNVENVSFTFCVLGPIGTEALLSLLPPNKTNIFGVPIAPLGESVKILIESIELKTRSVFIPSYMKYIQHFKLFFPDFLDSQIARPQLRKT